MQTSPTIANLAASLVKAQAEMPKCPLDEVNPHFKSRFSSLEKVWDTARPTLSKYGLAVSQTFSESGVGTVNINTTLMHESGEYITGTLTMPTDKASPQGAGSAITYGRRYALAAILGLVSDKDDDAEGAEGRNGNGKAKSNGRPQPAAANDSLI